MENTNLEETIDVTDRISSLPDNLLEHILSLLSTKKAVKTCVLSKRWMSTWACVPVLDISIEEFRGGTLEEREAHFERFVKGVFENREWSKLEEFKIFWHADCRYSSSGALERVILHAMEFKPRVFILSDCKLQLLSFDSNLIFTCASLEKVALYQNLRNCVAIEPSSVNLPCLKSLYLACATMDDDFMDKLILGCPILEDLFLKYCVLNICRISSGKLRKLVLLNCCLLQCLKISTPLLLDLVARGCCRKKLSSEDVQEFVADMQPFAAYPSNIEIVGFPEDMEPLGTFSWENMAFLINARIEFPDLKYSDEFIYRKVKLLPSLSNVTSLDLHLCNSQIKVEPYPWIIMPTLLEEFKDFFMEDKLEDILYKREYLEMVQIIKYHTPDVLIDRLLKKLHKHVKTIGAIIIE